MTKRILAIILAVVMAMSVCAINVFADTTNMNVTAKFTTGTNIEVSWNAVPNATSYYIEVTNSNGGQVTTRTVTGTSVTITLGAYGDFNVNLTAKDKVSALIGSGSTKVNVPQSYTVNGITVSSVDSNNVKVSWSASTGVSLYYYTYTVGNSSQLLNGTTTDTSVTLNTSYSNLKTFTLKIGDANGTTIGAWSNNGGYMGGNIGTGNVWLNGTNLTWNPAGYGGQVTRYYVYYSVNGGNMQQYGQYTTNNYYPVSQILSVYGSYANLVFYVKYSLPPHNTQIDLGSCPANFSGYPGGYPNGGYGIVVQPSPSSGNATVSWSPYTGATSYLVTVTATNGTSNNYRATTTTYTIPYQYGTTYTISVRPLLGNNYGNVLGTAYINAQGYVTYNNASMGTGTWWGGSNGSNVIQGYNCYLTITSATSSTLTLTNTTSVGPYLLIIAPSNGTGSGTSMQFYSNTVTIPYGSNTSFSVSVIQLNGNQAIAGVSYTASTSSTGTNHSNRKSDIDNLTVKENNSSSITISWNAVSGATNYDIEYCPLDAQTYTSASTKSTSYNLPYGKNSNFEAYVWSWVGGVRRFVGSIVHVAGDAFTSSTQTPSNSSDKNNGSTNKPAENLPAYVTGLKGTVGESGSVILAWNAAANKPSYEVWYKKSTASTWKKLYTTSGRSLKINKLTNGTSYDFKVVANGYDSGILTMTPGTTSSTKTAADPSGTASTTAVPVINSISGGSGTITLSWTAVSGAKIYRVYVAEEDSTEYRTLKSSWSTSDTSITITGLKAGTYKVRIKTFSDSSAKNELTGLGQCDYRTVTVR